MRFLTVLAAWCLSSEVRAVPWRPGLRVPIEVTHGGWTVLFTLEDVDGTINNFDAEEVCTQLVEDGTIYDAAHAVCVAATESRIAADRHTAPRGDGGWDFVSRATSSPYFRACAAAASDSASFATFKTNDAYRIVLEHTPPSDGQLYLDHVRADAPGLLRAPLLDRFRLNDGIGYAGAYAGGGVNHDLHDFGAGVGIMSPSTLRYISILARLQREFGTEWRGWRVCEIGGGYGGQAHIVLAANPLIHSYTIYDQPAPAALQARYLAAMGWPGSIVRAKSVVCATEGEEGAAPQPAAGGEAADESEKDGKVAGKVTGKLSAAGDVVAPARCTIEGDLGEREPVCDLVLSNYALTELSAAVQAFYAERVLGGARVGAYIEGMARNLYVRDRFTHHRIGARPVRGGAEEAAAGDWLQLVEEAPGLPPTTTAAALLFDSNARMSRFVFRRQWPTMNP